MPRTEFNINHLMDEIFLEIFSFINPKVLRENLTLVCKRWMYLIRGNVGLSGKLEIKTLKGRELSDLTNLLQNWPKLKTLTLPFHTAEFWTKFDFSNCQLLEEIVVGITRICECSSDFDEFIDSCSILYPECPMNHYSKTRPFLRLPEDFRVIKVSFNPKETIEMVDLKHVKELEVTALTWHAGDENQIYTNKDFEFVQDLTRLDQLTVTLKAIYAQDDDNWGYTTIDQNKVLNTIIGVLRSLPVETKSR